MQLTNQNYPLSVGQVPDVHLHFADYFFQDDLKHFAWCVSKRLEEGHICVHFDEIMNNEALHQKSAEDKKGLKEHFLHQPIVSQLPEERKPFMVYNDRLYLHRYFHYE